MGLFHLVNELIWGESQMGSKICMNASCGTATTQEWKKGWPLRSGGYADLCYSCGSAYENSVFCDTFHLEESGWRNCCLCRKLLHCGCIASYSLRELLDHGGVGCTSCANNSLFSSSRRNVISDGFGSLTISTTGDLQTTIVENRMVGNSCNGGRPTQFGKIMEANEPDLFSQSQRGDTITNSSIGQDKQEELMHPIVEVDTSLSNATLSSGLSKKFVEVGASFSNAPQSSCLSKKIAEVGASFSIATQSSGGSSKFSKTDNSRSMLDIRDMHEPLAQPSLSMTLGAPTGTPNSGLHFSSGVADGWEQSKAPPPFQQGQQSRPILPKPPRSGVAITSEINKSVIPPLRMARPPVEGRGKSHLLPRYWPRITDQELQQLSGDLNSTIVPLFEKVLSASDAGRIGRLVLPKACAEAYFPPINQSEGLPLRIQDIKGKEWTFQFRFWPNNNSRMYVLEGVTPCIQSMQLRAGDTVIFSRIDPGGKLVMGFRKATNTEDQQDSGTSALPNGSSSGETSNPGVIENLPTVNGYSGLFETLKGGRDPNVNAMFEQLSSADGDTGWHKNENHGDRENEDSPQQPILKTEKKRGRNIGSKSKRLLMHGEDALELRLTWEEAQDLLRPPQGAKPNIVTIEDHEFEEYDEPPVFGKRTIFTSRPSGGQEQWAQCDDCSKWRRLSVDVLLPPKWTCAENVWDSSRCSCSVPEEMSLKELENLLRVGRDFKKRRSIERQNSGQEHEPSGLDALASAAVLGDSLGDSGETSLGETTKHPRHRAGCSCIVCIQPPSGKGKHKPTCTCNVCMTVKRRFKTLMLRKKKRQSELEAEAAQKDQNDHQDKSEKNGTMGHTLHKNHSENEGSQSRIQADIAETSNGKIDLNCHPNNEDMQLEDPGMSIMSLLQGGSLPLENFMKPNGLPSLMSEQQASSCLLSQANGHSERCAPEDGSLRL